jgi:alpha-ketoglutarate-dependent taurine dioxygenase
MVASSIAAARTASGPRAWRADTIDSPEAWYYPLGDDCLAALEPAVHELAGHARPVTELRITAAQRSACRNALEPVRLALEAGRGFAIIDGMPLERYTSLQAQAIYWLVGQCLGEPFAQNVQGTLLYDVRDTGQSVAQGARFSVTNYESSFHTDNSFGAEVLDYVGLLCLNTARSGGLSQVLSGYTIYGELGRRYPEVLETLCRPFHVDRRGGTREGEASTVRFPVIQMTGDELLFRYLRYWIEAGHEKVSEPLTAAQRTALDTLDRLLGAPEFRAEFPLRPGQMFFINNRWILHNRTAFEDHAEPERRRHYVRLWLQTSLNTR